jgi:hypothetical protein
VRPGRAGALPHAQPPAQQEYEAFAGRDLSEFALAYFFVDGVTERLHAGLPREAVLCAWGITKDGRKVLLQLAPGTKETLRWLRASYALSTIDGARRASALILGDLHPLRGGAFFAEDTASHLERHLDPGRRPDGGPGVLRRPRRKGRWDF